MIVRGAIDKGKAQPLYTAAFKAKPQRTKCARRIYARLASSVPITLRHSDRQRTSCCLSPNRNFSNYSRLNCDSYETRVIQAPRKSRRSSNCVYWLRVSTAASS